MKEKSSRIKIVFFILNIRTRSWNGKIVNIERKEDGLLLTIDFIQKSTTTCYEEL